MMAGPLLLFLLLSLSGGSLSARSAAKEYPLNGRVTNDETGGNGKVPPDADAPPPSWLPLFGEVTIETPFLGVPAGQRPPTSGPELTSSELSPPLVMDDAPYAVSARNATGTGVAAFGARRAQLSTITWCATTNTAPAVLSISAASTAGNWARVSLPGYVASANCGIKITINAALLYHVFSSVTTESGFDYMAYYLNPTGNAASGTAWLTGLSGVQSWSSYASGYTGIGMYFYSDGSVQGVGGSVDIVPSTRMCNTNLAGTFTLAVGGRMYVGTSGYTSTVTYGNSWICSQYIAAPAGYVVTVTQFAMNTESGFDFITLYDSCTIGTTQIWRSSGAYAAAGPWTATGQCITFYFTSDGTVTPTIGFGGVVMWTQLTAVAVGSYRTDTGVISLCSAGYYGSTTALTVNTCSGLCSAGYYGATTGLTVATCTGQCTAGYYGTASTVRTAATCDGLCAAGYYGATAGLSVATCTGLCSAGY